MRTYYPILLIILCLVLSGLTQAEPRGKLKRGLANIESAKIEILETVPIKVNLIVTGYLPDGCTSINAVDRERIGDKFTVIIRTVRPWDKMCTMMLQPFEKHVELDVRGLKAGAYQVEVNDYKTQFQLTSDVANDTERSDNSSDAEIDK